MEMMYCCDFLQTSDGLTNCRYWGRWLLCECCSGGCCCQTSGCRCLSGGCRSVCHADGSCCRVRAGCSGSRVRSRLSQSRRACLSGFLYPLPEHHMFCRNTMTSLRSFSSCVRLCILCRSEDGQSRSSGGVDSGHILRSASIRHPSREDGRNKRLRRKFCTASRAGCS